MTMASHSTQRLLAYRRPHLCAVLSVFHPHTGKSCRMTSSVAEEPPKPFSSIPGPKGLPFIGTFMDFLRMEKFTIHKFFLERSEKYGPIYREKSGPLQSVLIRDPTHIKEMMKYEGKYPSRTDIAPWKLYRNDRDLSHGTLLSEGEEWQKHRHALNAHMMRTHNVALHTDDFNAVVTDLVEILEREMYRNHGQVPDLQKHLFRWSLESSCMVIFDERLGCLLPTPPADIIQAIRSVEGILQTTEQLLVMPAPAARALGLPVWKQHCQHWDFVIGVGEGLVKKKMQEVQAAMVEDREVTSLIGTLVKNGELTAHEINMNCVDLMGGAVETTSNTLLWLLYLLSKYPDAQRTLWNEIRTVAPSGEIIGQKQLREMHYLKAALKETLRLYPVAPFISRILKEDAVIAGYSIPKDTLVIVQLWSMARDSQIYNDAESFRPERWLRENSKQEQIHPFANLPFGHGARACIGRRIAELEIFLLVTRLLQKYEVQNSSPDEEADSQTALVLQPKGNLNLVFKPRT